MTRQAKSSFWSDFRTGLFGFADTAEANEVSATRAFSLDVVGGTGPFKYLNGHFMLLKPPGEKSQTWVTDDGPDGFYLIGSALGWRLQQGDGPDFSSGWEDGPLATYVMRGIGRGEGQTLTAIVSPSD